MKHPKTSILLIGICVATSFFLAQPRLGAQEPNAEEEPQAEEAPAHYAGPWFTFDYPRDWKIAADEAVEESHFVLMQTLGNATASISRFPLQKGFELESYSATGMERWKSGFPEEDVRDLRFTNIEKHGIKGRKAEVKVRTLLGWEDITHEFYSVTSGDSFIFLHFNAPQSERRSGVQEDYDVILENFEAKKRE